MTVKYPIMRERVTEVQAALQILDEIRQSRSDPVVFLFYRAEVPGRWVCAVAKRLNAEGFLLMKDRSGRVIGFEKLNFSVSPPDHLRISFETGSM